MEYRVNRRTGDRVSEIGMGAHLTPATEKEGVETLQMAYEAGINFYDFAAAESACFDYYDKAFGDARKNVFYQIHFGTEFSTGVYGKNLALDSVKKNIDWQLSKLNTDYIDYGFIHCLDTEEEWNKYLDNGVLAYIEALKQQGVVRHIGMSSHTPSVAALGLDTGLVDMLMFSINAGYDYCHGEYAVGASDERMELYKRCEKEDVGISVMKVFSAGQLLSEKTSPFGKAMTEIQCLQYALDKPGVLTVLPGIMNKAELQRILSFYDASPSEKDYSMISSLTPAEVKGVCVYCNHCQPCPAGLDVGLINKYYDLAKVGDSLAVDHYANLEKKAEQCTACGHCDKSCPFGVGQSERMKEIAAYFGDSLAVGD
ncbi:(4Fe-4S)-binding protein [Anaerotruncus sp. 80]|uniref:(4Fe-4S)-binding protein n=1 Tax=Anaerotruncus colihominis TaxID=169435 RepID=A0A845QGK4_9FIRM|nr:MULTISPECIES: aldo/keto reductase [Anaerotruncus]NBH60526.1 (4Fe-4S)-binding protein [Anaerotruncus colihominis]NCF01180.1 (4Fe-4S)-binding protein [Anaerotruncus sp. 80]